MCVDTVSLRHALYIAAFLMNLSNMSMTIVVFSGMAVPSANRMQLIQAIPCAYNDVNKAPGTSCSLRRQSREART